MVQYFGCLRKLMSHCGKGSDEYMAERSPADRHHDLANFSCFYPHSFVKRNCGSTNTFMFHLEISLSITFSFLFHDPVCLSFSWCLIKFSNASDKNLSVFNIFSILTIPTFVLMTGILSVKVLLSYASASEVHCI